MRVLSSKTHGMIDYMTVLLLVLSPYLFTMSTGAGFFTYSLAIVHLLLTLFTNFELGIIRVIPLYVHGIIELIVAILLVVAALGFRLNNDNNSFYFYLIFSLVLFVVWRISLYKPYSSKRIEI